jgi:hypothetical protein
MWIERRNSFRVNFNRGWRNVHEAGLEALSCREQARAHQQRKVQRLNRRLHKRPLLKLIPRPRAQHRQGKWLKANI